MADHSTWEHFFKPEVRSQGDLLFEKGAVAVANASDSQVNAYVRTSSSAKVALTSESIASEQFSADCNCTSSKKGQLCKHIWATIRKVEESHPDFFDSKTDIVKGTAAAVSAQANVREPTPEQVERKQSFQAKQAEYRKSQYQAQKERMKERKQAAKVGKSGKASRHDVAPSYEPEVQAAIDYFNQNGFPLESISTLDGLRQARKILSAIFHPDKGGTHEEMLTLNENFEVIETGVL